MLNSPQSPYFTNALKPWLDFLLNKTSHDKSGASLGWGWWGWRGRKKRRMRREEEDLGLPPSPAFVSSSCLLMQRLPISSSQSTPHLLHPAPEPSPGGFLSTSHRQGVRRNCNWNTDYMNNEPETTRMTRNRDQGLR